MQLQLPSLNSTLGVGTLVLNLVAFVWAVAKVTNKLENVVTAFTEYRTKNDEKVKGIETALEDHNVKIEIMWDGRERRRSVVDRREDFGA